MPAGRDAAPAPGPVGGPWWRSPIGKAGIGLAALLVFYMLTEHTAHVFGVLPYLLLLACPLMHLVMHRHHDHGKGP